MKKFLFSHNVFLPPFGLQRKVCKKSLVDIHEEETFTILLEVNYSVVGRMINFWNFRFLFEFFVCKKNYRVNIWKKIVNNFNYTNGNNVNKNEKKLLKVMLSKKNILQWVESL